MNCLGVLTVIVMETSRRRHSRRYLALRTMTRDLQHERVTWYVFEAAREQIYKLRSTNKHKSVWTAGMRGHAVKS